MVLLETELEFTNQEIELWNPGLAAMNQELAATKGQVNDLKAELVKNESRMQAELTIEQERLLMNDEREIKMRKNLAKVGEGSVCATRGTRLEGLYFWITRITQVGISFN